MNTTTLILCGLLALGSTLSSHAFKPNEGGHLGISRIALADPSVTRVCNGTTLKFSKRAIEEILKANAHTDWSFDFFEPTYHFDDENFRGGSSRLVDLRTNIIFKITASSPDGDGARVDLGGAFHTLQDFYAHSSWVELGNGSINTSLGRSVMSNPSFFSAVSAIGSTTFLGRDGLPSSPLPVLTSGYFLAFAPCSYVLPNKVRHGAALALCPSGLNKDEPGSGGGIPGDNFYYEARDLAIQGSIDFLQQILNDSAVAGNCKAIRALMDANSIGFVVDATASMAEEIGAVRGQVAVIVNSVRGTDEEPSDYMLKVFRDPDVPTAMHTGDANELLSWVNSIVLVSNDDCPEPGMAALLEAIKSSPENTTLYFFSDASASDSASAQTVSTEAHQKKIRINYLLTGSCSPIDPGYVQVANQTGGQLFVLSVPELASLPELVRPQRSDSYVTILSSSENLSPGTSREFLVPVDSTVSNLTFSVSIDPGASITAAVTDPTGAELTMGQPGVTVLNLTWVRMFRVATPAPGQWRLRVGGSGHFSANVTGNSAIQFYAFDFVELTGRPAHEGYFPIAGNPIAGLSTNALATLFGPVARATFQMISPTGEVVQTISLTNAPEVGPEQFLGAFRPPLDAFKIRVVGQDSGGMAFQRMFPMLFAGQPIDLRDAQWVSMGGTPGADGAVKATVADGSGLYIGGSFSTVGDALATNVARWNGTRWLSLGLGLNGQVRALAALGGNIYAAGDFTAANGGRADHIAMWDGATWWALGSGLNGSVSALAVLGTNLYVAGSFTTAGTLPATNIARWNGNRWSALDSGIDGSVYALAVSGDDLYAGGRFSTAGGSAAANLAKWNGSSWAAVGAGINGTVYSLGVSGPDLCVGGSFTTAGGLSVVNIAKWSGSEWSALGSGINGPVYSIAIQGGDLYVGGAFAVASGVSTPNIAKWNGNSWSSIDSGIDGPVYSLSSIGAGDLFAGGSFRTAGGKTANSIAGWSGSAWSALAPGMNNLAFALAVSGSDLYAGGGFGVAGSSKVNQITQWDGTNWSALGSGMGRTDGIPPTVRALVASEGDLYAGGTFTTAGGDPANYIAKWNATNWSSLGSGMNGAVLALAASSSYLYAAGDFTTAGGNAAQRIAKWDGGNWSSLGSGLGRTESGTPQVRALAVFGGDLYAGGNFTTAGGNAANYIAKWNGSNWSSLGSGMGPTGSSVHSLAVLGSDLYAGGEFTIAGGSAANRIAKWNGTNWSSAGSGINGTVYALGVSGRELYAGGFFTTAGGNAANRVAKWNGRSWSALGSGLGPFVSTVYSLAVKDSDMYLGGSFTTAGTKVSAYIARVRIGSVVRSLTASHPATVEFSGVPSRQYDIQRTTSLDSPNTWTTVSVGPLSPAPDGFFNFTDSNPPSDAAYYRAVER